MIFLSKINLRLTSFVSLRQIIRKLVIIVVIISISIIITMFIIIIIIYHYYHHYYYCTPHDCPVCYYFV